MSRLSDFNEGTRAWARFTRVGMALLLQAILPVGLANGASTRSGSVTLTSGANRVPVTLAPAVDPTKAIVFGGDPARRRELQHGGPPTRRASATTSKNGSTLALDRLGSPANAATVAWQVVESPTGVFVQRGLRLI